MKKARIKTNYLWNVSYQLLLMAVPLVTTPYLARVLGADQVGVFSYTNSIANYFVLLATLGMGQYGVRVIAQSGASRASRSRAFWSAWFAQLCFAIPVAALYMAYVFSRTGSELVVSLAWALWVISSAIDISWLFFGVEEFRIPTIRNAITKVSSVIVILMFVKKPEDLWIYILAVSSSFFVNAIALFPYLREYVDLVLPRPREVREHFLPNIRLFAPVVACSMYLLLEKVLLANISGMVETGYYEYSEKVTKIPMALVTALGTVMLPHMTAKIHCGKREEAKELLYSSFELMETAAMGMMFGIMAVSQLFTVLFLGDGFSACARVIPILALTVPVISASNVIGVQYMLPCGYDTAYTKSVWMGALINVAMCILLLKPLGARGAAVVTVLTELTVLFFQISKVKHELNIALLFKQCVPSVLVGATMFAVLHFAERPLASIFGYGWLLLIIEILVGAAVYLVLTLYQMTRRGRIAEVIKTIDD